MAGTDRGRRICLAAAALSLAAGAPAFACADHGGADNYFLAYIDYSGMTEAEQFAAEQRAIAQYHAAQIDKARAQFVTRFKVDPAPTTVARADAQ
ncbi:hypothetical protein [Sphingobium algorifonticola]|uniref:DUF4148 domain-containing protein n=1 Tax=Sphingobium algorifonticola TaxID=2008318 RepID=A0A437J4U0_9SPHN|nr:hypothetical protein [Sphingobium algorifonticola]RVT39766.1 hypothetical protein ENE74_13500 [Sphingobium algorifonticola]